MMVRTMAMVSVGVMAAASATQASPLVAHYKLDETSGTTAFNSVAGATDGTLIGTGTVNNAGAFAGSTAYSFNNDGGVEVVLPSFLPSGNNISIAGWIKTTDNTSNTLAGFSDISASNQQLLVGISGDAGEVGHARSIFRAGPFQDTESGVNIADDEWHHLVATFSIDGGTQASKIYVDGVLADSQTFAAGGFPTGLDQFSIGFYDRNGGVVTDPLASGLIDDVQVYDITLDDDQAAFLFRNPGSVIPEPASLTLLGLGGLMMLRRRRSS